MPVDKPLVSRIGNRALRTGLLRTLSLAPLALVAACGDGGGGGAVVSTPPGPDYQKLADITASTTLATQAATYQYSRTASAATPTLQSQTSSVEISYDAGSKAYTLRGSPVIGSSATVTQTFRPSDAVAGVPGSYENAVVSGSRTDVGKLSIGVTPLTYTNFGKWTAGVSNAGDQTFDTLYFSYGIATKASDMPKTGSASYTLQIMGEGILLVGGTGSLTANFASSTVNVSLGLTAREPRGGAVPFDVATVTGSGTIAAAGGNPSFSGNLSGDGFTGSINGLFYGPQASEVGGAFAISRAGSGPGSGSDPIAGAVIGKKN